MCAVATAPSQQIGKSHECEAPPRQPGRHTGAPARRGEFDDGDAKGLPLPRPRKGKGGVVGCMSAPKPTGHNFPGPAMDDYGGDGGGGGGGGGKPGRRRGGGMNQIDDTFRGAHSTFDRLPHPRRVEFVFENLMIGPAVCACLLADKDPDGGGGRGGGGAGGRGGRGGRGGSGPKEKMAFTRVVPKFLQQYGELLERPKWHTEEGERSSVAVCVCERV